MDESDGSGVTAHEHVMGSETEYGVFAECAPGQAPIDPVLLSRVVVEAVESPVTRWDHADEYPLVDARGHIVPRTIAEPDLLTDEAVVPNRVLVNGGRSYVDHAHPEWSGPEVTSARDALVWDRAGDLIHSRAADVASGRLGRTIHLVKNTTDNKGRSYGCHENHLVPREVPFDLLVTQFAGFLASRVVLVGAGRVGLGQDGRTPGFQTSQKADFIECLVGLQTTVHRPLVNARDEPHADASRWRRVHVITGDANLCQVAHLVKLASAAMALEVVARGVSVPGPIDPVAATKVFSRDPSCTVRVPCSDGRERTAVELQRLWWQASRPFDELGHRLWGELLDDLAVDPMRCADRLDWVAKLRLLEGLRQRHGLGWEDPRLEALDLRYGDLTSGLFARLEASGAVSTLVSQDEVAEAAVTPPASTRAWLRGTLVERFGAHVAAASWDRVVLRDGAGRLRALRLVDPGDGTRTQWQARLASTTDIEELSTLLERLGWTTKEAS